MRPARVVALGALVAFVVLLVVLLLGGGGSYTIKGEFTDAGQVVRGGVVQVGGRNVGKISDLRLADDGRAEVVMKIDDDEITPLHKGTIATIRAVGLVSVSGRVIELSPGPYDAPTIPDGGSLPNEDTRPIVDLDAVLDALDPKSRKLLQNVVRDSSKIYAGSAEEANTAFHYLSPALSQTAALSRELVLDKQALSTLLNNSADVSSALASRRGDLEQAVTGTAITLRAIASQRQALEDTLARAPGVLRQGRGTLRRARGTLEVARPALRDLSRSAPALARLLRTTVPATERAIPVLRSLRGQLPSVRKTLNGLPPLAATGVPALGSAATAIGDLQPVVSALRPYAPDLVNGFFTGFGGAAAQSYDANGHFARIQALVGLGSLSPLLSLPGLNLGLVGSPRTGHDSRCPGSAAEPAPDASNPYAPDASLCDRGNDKH